MVIGAHVSIKGGFPNAVGEAVSFGARAFSMFTGSQKNWIRRPLGMAEVDSFKNECKKHGFSSSSVIPHASYLINLGGPDDAKLQKSREGFLNELRRCEQLGLNQYNVHPGSHLGQIEIDEALDKVAESINMAHKDTKSITVIVENDAGQGHHIGFTFEQLRRIIDKVHDKTRVGISLDTCHLFVAGYDLSSKEKTLEVFNEFDKIIGFNYLRSVHLNDSKRELNSRVDRHESPGKGAIGLDCFKTIVNDKRFSGIPLILESYGDYGEEIKLLYSLVENP